MAKVSAKYETIFIIDLTVGEEKIKELVEKFKSLIEANGTLQSIDEWGKRRFAYPINVFAEFESVPSFPAELDRVYKITEGIMRSIIVCNDEK